MRTEKRKFGDLGERAAVNFLKGLGYKIIYTNYLIPRLGEIDIVAIDPGKTLVFIEVKTMHNVSRETFSAPCTDVDPSAGYRSTGRSMETLLPEDQLTKAKIRKMKNAVQMFHVKHSHLVGRAGFRIDAIAMNVLDSSDISQDQKPGDSIFRFEGRVIEVRHYKNVS